MKIEINLWELLWKSKMNVAQLSRQTWISKQQLSNMKLWKTKRIDLNSIEKLIKAFNCTPSDLFKLID